MDLSRIYTKTSRGILDGNLKTTRELGREHGRLLVLIDGRSTVGDLLEKNSRLSQNRLAAVIDELVAAGFIRLITANSDADDFGFSSTIIVDETNTQAFFEAQAAAENNMRRAEDQETITKVQERESLLKEVTADIAAEAAVLTRQESQRQARAADAETAALREQKAQAEAKARKTELEAQQRAQSEAQTKARLESEKKARQTEKQAKLEQQAIDSAKQQARKLADVEDRLAKEQTALARRTLEAKIQAEEEAQRRAEMESRLHAMEHAKNQAQQETQTLSKALDEARIGAELEARVKRRLEARAREEAETQAKLDAARKAAAEVQARAEEAARRQAAAEVEVKLEIERKVRMAAEEAQRQAEAAAQAKLEAERKAHIEAEQKAQVEAAARAQVEAAAQALRAAEKKAAAEAQARAEKEALRLAAAEAEATLEAERKARIEAEQKAQAEAAARAQQEAEKRAAAEALVRAEEESRRLAAAEAEATLEAERKARIEAEQKAQAEAEARAQAEVQAQARQEAKKKAAAEAWARTEEAARRQAEESQALAVAAAEEAVRQEAETVKRQLEEQQRAEDARRASEVAEQKLEAERRARALAESTAQALAAERQQMELTAKSREQERMRAREDANAKALAEMEEAMRRTEVENQREANEEACLREEAQARAMAAAQAATLPFLVQRKRKPFRFDKRWYKQITLAIVSLLLLAIGLAHVLPLSFYTPKLERQLKASLGQRVVIQDLHFSAYPMPHLELEGVAIGDGAGVNIAKAHFYPTFTSWFSDVKVMRRVELEALSIAKDSINALPIWSQQQARTVPIQFEHLQIKNGKLAHPLLDVFAFDAAVDARNGRFIQAQIKGIDQRVTINLLAQGDALHIDLNALKSVLPFAPRIPFDTLKIVALAKAGSMTLSSIDAQLFDGYLSGTGFIDWGKGWNLKADLALQQITVAPALAHFTKEAKLTGSLEAKVRLAAQAETLESLFATPQVQATFRVKNGEYSGIDLVRSIQAQSRGGNINGKTHFNDLSGYFQYAKSRYQYRQFKLQGGVVSAAGNLEFGPERSLFGNLVSDLQTRSAKQRMAFVFTGSVAAPSIKAATPLQRAVAAPPVSAEDEP